MARPLSAVVAGGGIGGLAAAAALGRSGVAVTVIERAEVLTDVGSGLVLYPNGVAAADAISTRLSERLRSVGHVVGPDEVRLVIDASGRVLARDPIGETGRRYGMPQISLLRTALQEALADEATTAGARLRLGRTVQGYASTDGAVRVHVSDGSTVVADLLVAADGIWSGIRQRMLGDGPPRYRGYTSVRGRTSGSWVRPQGFVANGRGVQFFVAPVADDALYWTAKITAPPGVWPEKSRPAALRALAEMVTRWHGPVVRLITDADPGDVAVADIYDRDPVPRWVDDRVVLLGDAAHPMTPALGQAANMALEDAVVLADALGAHGAVDGDGDVATALRAYERQRTARTARVTLLSRRQGARDQGAGRIRSLVRDAGMRLRGRKDTASFDIVAWSPPNSHRRPRASLAEQR